MEASVTKLMEAEKKVNEKAMMPLSVLKQKIAMYAK